MTHQATGDDVVETIIESGTNTSKRVEADPRTVPEHDFNVGDVVTTKGDDVPVTIEHIEGHIAAVVWFNMNQDICRSNLLIATIEHFNC
ncbi:hypothetical protein HAP48_0042650 [Bradyrhizobium septentrionale]|uniref:DUF2158 domain-containing protein n=1 Tax=Bradyrhizobium septentrionale TaxID=1404411 RepID=A0A974A2R5_9BRAD|nr:hypothetical protein [Bradyrhizobium septentrionale]UGY15159.1 hypothetical protein HAP48_0042650 [Bradyrhizobium septentrionale]